jgi:hypothetical protein
MIRTFGNLIKARWRWQNNRCPLCSRSFDAVFKYFVVGHEKCPCCMKDPQQWENEATLYLWRRYRMLAKGIRIPKEAVASHE